MQEKKILKSDVKKPLKFLYSNIRKKELFLLYSLSVISILIKTANIFLSGYIVQDAIEFRKLNMKFTLIFLILTISEIIIFKLKTYISNRISYKVENRLLLKSVNSILDIKQLDLEAFGQYEINNILTQDGQRVKQFINKNIEKLIFFPLSFLIYFIFILKTNTRIGLIISPIIILSSLFNIFITDKLVHELGKKVEVTHTLNSYEQDIMGNQDLVRSYRIFDFVLNKYENSLGDMYTSDKSALKVKYISYIPGLINEYLPILVLSILSLGLIMNKQLNYGDFIILVGLVNQVSLPFTQFLRILNNLKIIEIYEKNFSKILSTDAAKSMPSQSVSLKMDCLSIELKHVDFSYEEHFKNTLNDLSLSISDKEKVLITGPSGIGKSTLIKLVSGVLEPIKGLVKVYGIDPFDNERTIFENIAIIDQKQEFFKESIPFNISLKKELTDEEKVRLNEIIIYTDLDQLCTEKAYIEKNGQNLSGGQKLRILVARALFSQRKIMLLDEPDFAIDEAGIDKIYQLITSIDSTVLVITHNRRIHGYFDKHYIFSRKGKLYEENANEY
ncbi:ATP-binding cassette domain-containing protein [Neofamilia massiliensis]|uniref:ATP-binding cassette domain-containing protein n=1 Tax=Neofamilia massiliensis TaxID=1673724 RepID=UPI0006BB8A7B|nr:ABC transporter ATP-binding protein [Neofamilia massiliensis]